MGNAGIGEAWIEVDGLTLVTATGQQCLLNDISFGIPGGAKLGLLGESGSGKTLLCRAIAGLLPSTVLLARGRVSYGTRGAGGLAIREHPPVAMVPQFAAAALPPLLTPVALLTAVARWNLGLSPTRSRRAAAAILARVGFGDLHPALTCRPHQLSSGMGQRVAIGAAFVTGRPVVLLDEPSSGQDPVTRHEIATLLRSLSEERGVSIVVATHDLVLARGFCDRIVVLHEGRLIADGSFEQLAATRDSYVRQMLDSSAELPT